MTIPPATELINDRYQLVAQVGEGGMATVHSALDLGSGRQVALKRLRYKTHRSHEAMRTLFEREFLVLSELSHPRIVAVHDYGVDAGGPYYTMELLDGSDLQRLAPLAAQRVCALGHDVCSALALLHSRRLVYRDLSPQNVRCTADGLAKLIDFGALAPMGPRDDLVGTLPCVAPEVVARRPLDARTDLYALGATLYFALTRRHAYPARNLEELTQLWQTSLRLPSEWVPGIPRALDALVRDLLQPDPAHRPQSAMEVMERLQAVGELALDESLLVQRAYLSQPALVGREPALQVAREHMARVAQGQGGTLRIAGVSGAGISRLLHSCLREGKLAGWLVLHADAGALGKEQYASAAAVGRALLEAAPQLARVTAEPDLPVLGGVVPELLANRGDVLPTTFDTPEARHRRTQPALREWLKRVAQQRPLLLAVDQVQRMDAPSAAFLALLGREARRHRMLLLVGQPDDQLVPQQSLGALRLLEKIGSSLTLELLSLDDVHLLLGSVFGEVPNLELLSRYVHPVTGGNPRDVMALAMHMVTVGAIRYEAGCWSLPARICASDLPPSMADAFRQRVERLSPDARALAYAVSREPAIAFSLDELRCLSAAEDSGERTVHELLTADLLVAGGEHYRVPQKTWSASLADALSEAERRAAHLRLASLFKQRDDGFRHAVWLLRAGMHERGLTALTDFAVSSCEKTDDSPAAFNALMGDLPEDWFEACEEALTLYETCQRPARERFLLLNRLAGIISRGGRESSGFKHVAALLTQLAHDAGLTDCAALPAELSPGARIQQALASAKQRYLSQPEQARVYDPGSAIQGLARVTVVGLGCIATTSDFSAFKALPSLTALAPLAPGLHLVQQLSEGLGHRVVGRTEKALEVYEALLARLAQPDRAGLGPSHHAHTQVRVMGSIGVLEAALGHASSLAWAERVANAPGYEHVGALVPYLYHLWQGNTRESRRHRRRFEVLQLELNAVADLQHVFSELAVHALVSDMTGVRRAIAALDAVATSGAAARAAAHYGRGEYHLIRGDLPAAREALQEALSLLAAGEHVLWANAAGAHLRVLSGLGLDEEARALGEQYLAAGDAAGLGYVQNYVRCPLSLALSALGEHEHAGTLAASAVAVCSALQITGLNAALAHETLVQVCMASGDQEGLARSLAMCSPQFQQAVARHAEAADRVRPTAATAAQLADASTGYDLETAFATCMISCHTLPERAAAGLDFMRRHLDAKGGVLYLRRDDQLVKVAESGEHHGDEVLRPWTTRHLEREERAQATDLIDDLAASSNEAADEVSTNMSSQLDSYVPIPLAHCDETGFALTGIMALRGSLRANTVEAARLGAELSRTLSELGEHGGPRRPSSV